MINLDHYFSPGIMDGFYQLIDVCRVLIGADQQHFGAGFALRVDARVLHIDISKAAFCAFNIVIDLALGHEAFR
jgi:hypothetical protein